MTKREYLLWLQAKRNQHPGITMQPSRPGPYGEPQWASFGGRPAWMDQQQVPAKDITTVIKEYEGDTPNTKTTTIKGGLLGDPAQDWDGSGAALDPGFERLIQGQNMDPGFQRTVPDGRGAALDPGFQRMMPGQDRGMVDPTWSSATAVNRPSPTNLPGTDFFGGGVTAPNGERAAILEARKRKFLEREAQELAARQKMREQTGGAAPTQAQVEESLGSYGDFRREQFTPPPIGVSSPQRARTRLPQPARLPLAHGQDDPQDQRGMKGRPWVLPQDARAELERKRREADQRQRYAQQELGRMTPPPESRPVDTGSSIADARMAAIAQANQIEADEARASHQAAQQRLAKSEAPVDYGQDDPREADEAEERRRQAMARSAYPDMRIDQKSVEGTIYGEASTGQKVVAEILGIAPDIYRRGINSLLMFLGAEEDDDILIETDPTEWIKKKLQENPYLIRNSKKFLLDTIEGGVDTAKTVGEETVDHWVGKLDEVAKEIGAEDKSSIVPKLIDDAHKHWMPKIREQHKRRVQDRLNRLDNEKLGRAAIARGPDDPALLYDDPRRRAAQAAREKLPRMGIGRGPDLPDPSGVPKTDVEKKAADKSQAERVAAAGTDVVTSKKDNNNELQNNPQLAALWGKYAYDPAARKKVYLDNLKQVYKKALMLDIIAQLTGGKSRSKEYLKMATTKLDAVDQFDQEQRVSNIWKQVFTGTDGQFYMPKDKREAAERAHFFGGDPKTVSSIFGSVPEEKRKVQYYREDPNDPDKWEVIRSDVDPGPTFIAGTPRSKTPGGDKLLADKKLERYNQLLYTYQNATGEGKEAALRNLENWASFAKLKTGGVTEQQNRAFAKDLWKLYFTEDEALLSGAPTWEEYYYGTGEFVLPKSVGEKRTVRGYGAGGGGEATSGPEKSYESEADFTARAESEGVKSGDWVLIAGKRRQVE